MKRNRWTILCAALLLLPLAGCQLAAEGQERGQLAGLFVTTEPLGRYDAQDPQEQPEVYEGKEETLAGGETTYTFPSLEGEAFYVTLQGDEAAENGRVWNSHASQGIWDPRQEVAVDDGGERVHITGTFLTPPLGEGLILYAHPIYRTQAGGVYVVPSNSGMAAAPSPGPGMEKTLTETYEVDLGGKKTTATFSVTLKTEALEAPTQYRLVQMGADNQPLHSQSFAPGQAPETVTALSDTAYFLLETHRAAGVSRELIQREETIRTVQETPQGYFIPYESAVIWP